MKRLALVLGLLASGCAHVSSVSGTSTVTMPPDGGVAWTVGVSIAFGALHAADTAVASGVSAASLPAAKKSEILLALHLVDDGIATSQAALQAYMQTASASDQCRLYEAVQGTITATLRLLQLLTDAGVRIDPGLAAAVGGLGSIADLLVPGCAVAPPVSAAMRLHAALGGH